MKDYDAISQLRKALNDAYDAGLAQIGLAAWDRQRDVVMAAILRKHDEAEAVKAGDCLNCGGPVYHRPGKPGEYDHMYEREAEASGERLDSSGKASVAFGITCDDGHPRYSFIANYSADLEETEAREMYEELIKAFPSLASRPAPTDEKTLRKALKEIYDWCTGEKQVDDGEGADEALDRIAIITRTALLAREAPKDKHPVTYPKKHVTDGSRKGLVIHAPKDESK
ncbi:MAG: hypothetical protein WC455_30970 [Dehalococcoidia bacterium]|jgi:hypothetical protein